MSTAPKATGAVDLTRFAWLSIAAALVTIALKAGAWLLTDSVGLLSDAAESTVNLVAAVVALLALKVAASPANKGHHYGRAKAEYFSAGVEGLMIFLAAIAIIVSATERFIHPQPLQNVGIGLAISVIASLVNGAVALVLLRAGKQYRSLTLTADGKHLMTDVITSAAVLIGVLLVWVTGLERLDPLVAFAVGINIIVTGVRLVHESLTGLLDESMSKAEHHELSHLLEGFVLPGEIGFHALRTRVSGQQRFAEVHVLVPGKWTVQQGHDFVVQVEKAVESAFDGLTLTCHLEPIEDPVSYEDIPDVHVPISSSPHPDDFAI